MGKNIAVVGVVLLALGVGFLVGTATQPAKAGGIGAGPYVFEFGGDGTVLWRMNTETGGVDLCPLSDIQASHRDRVGWRTFGQASR